MSSEHSGDGKDEGKDVSVAKTAGFVVFSGIAMSILKAFNPFNNNQITEPPTQQQPIVKVISLIEYNPISSLFLLILS